MFKFSAVVYLDISTVLESAVADNEHGAICLCLGSRPALFGLGHAGHIGEALTAWHGCTPHAWWE
jgi:hypothetical protein